MARTVEFLNPGKRRSRTRRRGRRRARGIRRRMTALQRRFFGPRKRRRKHNPSTFAVVPQTNPFRRRRRRHNPSIAGSLKQVTKLAGPALAATTTLFGGWTAGKTFLKGRDKGALSYAVNLAGGLGLAIALSMVFKKQRGALFIGAVMSPVTHLLGDLLKGRRLPFVTTGFEDAEPMGFQDFFTPLGSGLDDFLAPASTSGLMLTDDELSGFGYAEAGSTPFGQPY